MMSVYNSRLRLSQNEKNAILENEKRKWRNFRLQQVRAQSKIETERLLRSVKDVEEQEKWKIAEQEKLKWEFERKQKIEELEERCCKGFQQIGEAHRNAKVEADALQAFKARKAKDYKVAAKRGQIAQHNMDKLKAETYDKENAHRMQRERVLQKEKKRAVRIAKLPTPPRLKKDQRKPIVKAPKKVTFHDARTFTTTSYIPTDSIKIIKEKEDDHVSAKEAAKREKEKYEEIKSLKKKREEEDKRKIEERGKQATKRERTKEMYSQLMKEIEEAEEDHRLSDFLQGDDDEESAKAEILSRNLGEKIAEERARELLEQEDTDAGEVHTDLDEMPSKPGHVSRISHEREQRLMIRDLASTGRVEAEDSTDMSHAIKQPLSKSPKKPLPSSPKMPMDIGDPSHRPCRDIHLKGTVPVHEIPIIKEKFVVKVPQETPSSSTVSGTSVDTDQSPTSTGSESSVGPFEPKSDESSFEELKVRIIVDPNSSDSLSRENSVENKIDKTLISEGTEYLGLPRKTEEYLPKKIEQRSSSSSVVTEYYDIPESVASDSMFRLAKDNIRSIQERGKKVQKLIDALKERDDSEQEEPVRDVSAFKTPSRIYTESLKTEGSSAMPVSKKKKLEKYKKFICHHYLPLIMRMRVEDRNQLTVSTVEGSGISLSSEKYMSELVKFIGASGLDSTVSSIPTVTSDLLSKLDDQINRISTSSSSSRGISSSSSTPVSSSVSGNGRSVESESSELLQQEDYEKAMDKKEILKRLVLLQQLKQKVLLDQQNALRPGQESATTLARNASNGSENSPLIQQRSKDESTLEWSSIQSYETPSREICETSPSVEEVDGGPHYLSPIEDLRPGQGRETPMVQGQETPMVQGQETPMVLKSSDEIRPTKLSSRIGTRSSSSLASQSSKSIVSPLMSAKIVDDSHASFQGQHPEPTGVSRKLRSERNVEKSSVKVKKSASSSSSSSLPEMTQVLEKFGLWAPGMMKRMDRAEEHSSSEDSLKYKIS